MEHSGSVVECLTRDRGAAGLSLVLVQPRKTRPYITERLLMGCKETNQTIKYSKNCFVTTRYFFCQITSELRSYAHMLFVLYVDKNSQLTVH